VNAATSPRPGGGSGWAGRARPAVPAVRHGPDRAPPGRGFPQHGSGAQPSPNGSWTPTRHQNPSLSTACRPPSRGGGAGMDSRQGAGPTVQRSQVAPLAQQFTHAERPTSQDRGRSCRWPRCRTEESDIQAIATSPTGGTMSELRDGCSASIWMAPVGSGLLTLGASSVQRAPDGSRPIVWMIKWMIKGHPTENRMARRAERRGITVCGEAATLGALGLARYG
jgi:hypothetical protein